MSKASMVSPNSFFYGAATCMVQKNKVLRAAADYPTVPRVTQRNRFEGVNFAAFFSIVLHI